MSASSCSEQQLSPGQFPTKKLSLDSSSSSSDVSGTSTPPSSLSDSLGNATKVHLPQPFYPPSIAQIEGDFDIAPRLLPLDLELPIIPPPQLSNEIDSKDIGTPDAWIPRDQRLVRLTGKHPFNCEAKLKDLYAEGFLTPTNLFYVRNHGAVPRFDREKANNWELRIHGLCHNPITFTLTDLCQKFQVVTIPVTLVCAGNRRKEQNVVQKSLGFSWGASGISTALFTGVYLSDVLNHVQPTRSAKHVIFEGCDDLPNGPYGTSQKLSWAREKRKGMMLAWAMNGLALEPDHGFPLRLVVPGQIGGRSVKWINRIELSQTESQHHLHFHDNKVLPTSIGPEQARAEKSWWYDPRYIINELNVNSAIACPDHEEILDPAWDSSYTLKGYAYAGGGRRVTRVELSFDDGVTWILANISYPEDAFRDIVHSDPIYGTLDFTDYDTCFCWCFWSFEASLDRLGSSAAVMVRCMDESLCLQPRNMYWNATGMMNNWWFRVAIHQEGGLLRFEHPTMAGTQPGGWMQRLKDLGLDPTRPTFSNEAPVQIASPAGIAPRQLMTKADVNRKITPEELREHNSEEEPWFAVNGEVYNGAAFLKDHPGGSQSILLVGGTDASEDFMAIHSEDAKKQLANFHIGTLVGQMNSKLDDAEDDSFRPFLHPSKWKKVQLTSIQPLSRDSNVYRFALEREDQELGLSIGQHVYVRLRRKVAGAEVVQGAQVQRAYTPVSRQNEKGFIDLLIKIYYPNAQFPLGGKMTLGFSELAVGDSVELKGPIGHFIWKGMGVALCHGEEKLVREIGLLCAGSGITPILQVLRGILNDPLHHDTKIWLLYVNRYLEDILCREELHQLAEAHKHRCRLHHTLTGSPVPPGWEYSTGRVNDEMLKYHLPTPGENKLVCICGPSAMEQSTKEALHRLGWETSTQIVIF